MKLSRAAEILASAGIENPRREARIIFEKIGGLSLSEILRPDTECDLPEVNTAVERRKNREPLQYILGEVGFFRETYEVNENCLIPRQDTEILVDCAIKNLPCGARFLDLCTGSGCIAVSVLRNTEKTSAVATDLSESALSIAKRNAEKNGVSDRIDFLLSDALSECVSGEFFAVLSNPPYVRESDYENLAPEIFFEPKMAFVGDDGGLVFYKKILSLYKDKIHPDGFFAFEIGHDQGDDLVEISKTHNMSCEIIKDLAGLDRVAVIRGR